MVWAPMTAFHKTEGPNIMSNADPKQQEFKVYSLKLHSVMVNFVCQLTGRTDPQIAGKTLLELPYDPAIPLLGMYLIKSKTLIQKGTCTPTFIAALFTIDKIWKQLKCLPTD